MLLGSVAILPPCPLTAPIRQSRKSGRLFLIVNAGVEFFNVLYRVILRRLPPGPRRAGPGIPVMAMTANAEGFAVRGGAVKLFILVPFLPFFTRLFLITRRF